MTVDGLPLADHQELALRKLSNGKILYGDVGSGKTRVAIHYYTRNEAPKDVYVITTAKKRNDKDWELDFYKVGVGPKSGPVGPKIRRGKKAPSRSAGPGTSEAGKPAAVRTNPERALGDGGSGPERVTDLLLEGDRDGGGHGDPAGEFRGHPWVLTVDSWNNIGKYADVSGAFFIFDEQRLVGAGKWTRVFLRIAKRNTWILLSGTPGDTWMDYIPVFVANGFYKNRSEFKVRHVVYAAYVKFPKIDRYLDVGRLAKLRGQVLVEMPFVRHTRRRPVEVLLPYDKDALDLVLKKRWHVFEERPLNDIAEMFSVARRIVNGDKSRLDMVVNLWEMHPKLIVFYNFNYELESLRSLAEYYGLSHKSKDGWSTSSSTTFSSSQTRGAVDLDRSTKPGTTTKHATSSVAGLSVAAHNADAFGRSSTSPTTTRPSGLLVPTVTPTRGMSEWNGHKHQPIPKTDYWLYLVQYTAGAEGWNCIETDAMILYSQNYSWKVDHQARGRIDRLNTPFNDLWYYNFTSDSWLDRAIYKSLRAKQNFNEARYKPLMREDYRLAR